MRNGGMLWSALAVCVFAGLSACTTPSAVSEATQPENYGVPASFSGVVNPVEADDTSLQRGREIYEIVCIRCHDENGQGNGRALANEKRKPVPFNAPQIRELGDGELYYIITHGVEDSPMLAWSFFDDSDIWNLVNYIRSLQD
jgi:mono/diheme cytochrome c family protein